jgi:hypothetical protein
VRSVGKSTNTPPSFGSAPTKIQRCLPQQHVPSHTCWCRRVACPRTLSSTHDQPQARAFTDVSLCARLHTTTTHTHTHLTSIGVNHSSACSPALCQQGRHGHRRASERCACPGGASWHSESLFAALDSARPLAHTHECTDKPCTPAPPIDADTNTFSFLVCVAHADRTAGRER